MKGINVNFSKAQKEVFFQTSAKYNVVQKGGRLGFTRGGAEFFALKMATEAKNFLWGDTIQTNLREYIELFFLPLARKLSGHQCQFEYNKSNVILRCHNSLGTSVCHFRSAEKPRNWEGFGYDYIFLNEAGIILNGENGKYIWEQAVLKTLMSNPGSKLWAGGVPKGLNVFTDLIDRAKKEIEQGNKDWAFYHFTTYDNPWIPVKEIKEMEKIMGPIAKQEIYGEIISGEDDAFLIIPPLLYDEAVERFEKMEELGGVRQTGIDPSQGGDETGIAIRYTNGFTEIKTFVGAHAIGDSDRLFMTYDNTVKSICRVFDQNIVEIPALIDATGIGAAPWDVMKKAYPKLKPFKGAEKAHGITENKLYRFYNKISEAWWRCREAFERGEPICDPDDKELRQDLTVRRFEITRMGKFEVIKIESKDKYKKRLGRSPNKGDSFVLSWYESRNIYAGLK